MILIFNIQVIRFFFFLDFLSQTVTSHRAAGEAGDHFLTSLYHLQPKTLFFDLRLCFKLCKRHEANFFSYFDWKIVYKLLVSSS